MHVRIYIESAHCTSISNDTAVRQDALAYSYIYVCVCIRISYIFMYVFMNLLVTEIFYEDETNKSKETYTYETRPTSAPKCLFFGIPADLSI